MTVRIAWPETIAVVAIGLVAIEFSPPARERVAPLADARIAFTHRPAPVPQQDATVPAPVPPSRHDDGAAALRRP